jgi:iron complex transport system substrate-binding protein
MVNQRYQSPEPEREHLAEAIRIWTHSAVTLLDLRHQTISGAEPLADYRMPSSMFVCSYGGPADVSLNDRLYSVERFGIFHGAKGSLLSIRPTGETTNVYTVHYKAEEPPFYKQELKRLLSVVNPFHELYGFAPRNPIVLVEQLRRLHHRWNGCTPLDRFYGKAAFLQFVYEIYEELEQGGVQVLRPDIVLLVKHYIDDHYQEAVSLQDMAEMFHISAGHLTRLFKKQLKVSPQEYLIRTRVDAAQLQLLGTDATLREIAWSCGFSDEFNLIKMFKSCYGVTPGDFRKISSTRLLDPAIGNAVNFPYSNKGLAGLDSTTRKGEYSMVGPSKGTFMFSAALCLMLLLSACSTPVPSVGGTNASEPTSNQSAASQPTATQQAETAAATREFQHVGGTAVVPAEPQRIVADWFYGELLALGVRPIGYPEYLLSEYPYVDSEGTEGFGESIEQVIELKPDLIISTWDDSYNQYAKIAPSVLLKLNNGVFEKMRVLGELVNKQEEAEKWVASFEEKLAHSKQRLAEEAAPDTTVTILSIFQKDLKVYGYRNMGGDVLYNLLQMEPPQKVKEMFKQEDVWNHSVSFEALPEITGSHIILTAYDPEGTGREMLEQLEQSKIWNSLDAVKNGRVHKVDYYDLFFDDPIAIEHQIEMLTDMILQ